MTTPYLEPYSPIRVLRELALLPAAGAWDAAPIETAVSEAKYITAYLGYIQGAAGGTVDFRLEVSPWTNADDVPAGIEEWSQPTANVLRALALGTDLITDVQRLLISYDPVGATIEAFTYGPIGFQGTVQRIRVAAREVGVVGTPGNAYVLMYMTK